MFTDIYRLDTLEVAKIVWDTFAELARMSDSKEYFDLEGAAQLNSPPTSVYDIAFNKWKPRKSLEPRYEDPSFKYVVRKVYHAAISMGLIIPGRIRQGFNWGYSTNTGPFQFTLEGIKYFSNGFISVDDPAYLGIALKELQSRLSSIDDGKIELLLESQRCIKAGCYRAGMVVMGVANEDMCVQLLDSIPLNCNPPPSKSALHSDWNNCKDSKLAFSMRWKPGIRILEEIKNKIRKSAKGESWFQWWEMIPGSLYTLGEAVRIARNTAAHDSNRLFSKAEVALLLSAMPTQLEMLSNITEFLKSPPPHLKPIQI